ncbi:MAG: hypothetical protein ACREPI_11010, partial [Candidatus Dormibacterales bacterium]
PRPGYRAASWRALALGLVAAFLFGMVTAAEPVPPPAPSGPPLVGFSFSARAALYLGEDPAAALRTLLVRLRPDLVRIPVYWSDVAPTPDGLDFTETDRTLDVVRTFDERSGGRARVVLVVGARNLDYPELHAPGWLPVDPGTDVPLMVRGRDFRQYLVATCTRYRGDPLLAAWQVENEPLDNVAGAGVDSAIPPPVLGGEIRLVRSVDGHHPVVVTTYNSSGLGLDMHQLSPLSWLYSILPGPQAVGHPLPALDLGDVLGLDVYVVTPTTPLTDASARRRIHWKQDAIAFWSAQARSQRKRLWITEMQASPWVTAAAFTVDDLYYSAQEYRSEGASAVFLWGVEQWVQDPVWMAAGVRTVAMLRET